MADTDIIEDPVVLAPHPGDDPASGPDLDPEVPPEPEQEPEPERVNTDPALLIPTNPELALIAAAAEGEYCNFDLDHPEDERTIRADVLRALLMGARPDWKVKLSRIGLFGAVIDGPLDLIQVQRRDDRDAPLHSLLTRRCVFLKPVYLAYSAVENLEMQECEMLAVYARGLTVYGEASFTSCEVAERVDLESADFRKGVDFSDCKVGSDIYLLSARVARHLVLNGVSAGAENPPGVVAISLNGAEVGGAVFIRATGPADAPRHVECYGEFNAVGLKAIDGLYISGGRFVNPGRITLNFREAILGQVNFQQRHRPGLKFEADGLITFAFAQVAGSVTIRNGVLSPGVSTSESSEPDPRPTCLDLERASIRSRLLLQGLEAPGGGRPEGCFLLTGAEVGELMDDPRTGWPLAGHLDLLGFKYEMIDFRLCAEGDRSDQRLAWLNLQQSGKRGVRHVFRPQPYEQLVRVLRKMGYDEDADDVAIAKLRHRDRCRVDRPTSRLASRFIGVTSRYGYSPGRAAASAGFVVVVGTALIAVLLQSDLVLFLPTEATVVGDAPATTYVAGLPAGWIAPFGLGDHALWRALAGPTLATVPHGCPGLVAPVYALDLAIPVLDLGQESACRMESRGWVGGWLQAGRAVYQVLGAIMTAVLITTLTGLLRKD